MCTIRRARVGYGFSSLLLVISAAPVGAAWAQDQLPPGGPFLNPAVVPVPPVVTLTPPITAVGASPAANTGQNLAANAALPTTIAAGRTHATFSVANSGAATYTIPLWTPPGVGSNQLALSLSYSSRARDGVMGVGWTLTGLSAITRCNRTWTQDGHAQGITLTISDRLCLDGQQLKVVSASASDPAQGGTTFATEVESFSQITAAGSSGSAPTSLTVTTKNGLIYDYGLTTDSQIHAGPSGPIRAWALSQIRDRVGNKIKFSYYNDAESGSGYTNGSYRIKEIDYPYTASGQGPFYSVTFNYGNRLGGANVPAGYIAGSLVKEPNQLNTISVQNYGSSTPTKTYALTYGENSVSSRLQLQEVQECSASNCLPATMIRYQNGGQGWSSSVVSTGVASSPQASPIAIDLNGDGLTDILYPVTASGSTVHWWVVFSTGSGYSSPVDTGVITPNFPVIITGAFSGTGQNQFLVAQSGYWYVVTCSTSGCTSAKTNLSGNGVMFAADYDGDGLPDIVSASGNSVLVTRNITQPGGAVTFASTPTTVWTASSTVTLAPNNNGIFYAVDFNGDGRADILATTTVNTGFSIIVYWNVLLSNGFSAPATVTSLRGTGYNFPMAGDWNGDGCTDIISLGGVYLSDCAGGFTTLGTPWSGNSAISTIAVDWDGDGNTDLLYDNNGTWYVSRSTGTGIAGGVSTGLAAPSSTSWFPLDQNGDGLIDLAYVDANNNNTIYFMEHSGQSTPPDLAISFTDGFAMNQSPTYVPISQSAYTKCPGPPTCTLATFPEQDYQGPLYVVNQFIASDGTGSTYQNQFHYWAARVHVQGRGFEGFDVRQTYDTRNGVTTYDYDGQQFPFTGMFLGLSVNMNPHSQIISSWITTPQEQVVTGLGGYESRHFPYLQQTVFIEHEVGGALNGSTTKTTTTQYKYDDGFGNPTQVQTSVVDNDSTSPFYGLTWQTTVNTSYLNDTSANCFGLPSGTTTIQSVAPGQTAQTRTYSYTPDSNHTLCREQQQVIEPTTQALSVTTALGFDTCGNVSSVQVTGHNPDGSAMTPRTTSYNYGYFTARCQLPESIANALGQYSTISYNYTFGVPSTFTDPNGAPTSWQQDDFGRKRSETHADGTSTTWTYSYCVSDPCWGVTALRFLTDRRDIDSTGKQQFWGQSQFYDGMSRLRYDESYHAFGTWTNDQVLLYDSLGRVTTVYQPYSSAGNGYWSLGHDVLNRLTSASLYQSTGILDRTWSWTPQGRTTTIKDPLTNLTTQVADVMGKLRRVTDPPPGRTTSYDFDAFGNLNKITDDIGAVSSATYNLRGFKIQMVDADVGTWNFKGDSLNEVVSWTDANNNSFGAAYDLVGRVTSRTEREGTSTWNWGHTASLHDIGSLNSESGNGYSESLYYDSIGRLRTRVITTDQAYQYDYAYNSIGAIDTIAYPASPAPIGTTETRYKIQYGYSYGFPTQISDITQATATTLWTLTSANAYSSPTAESLGAGAVSINSTYTPWTDDLTSIQSGVSGSTTNRQDLAYQWDANGNLHQRQDLLQNPKETEVFSYDALNRLTSSTLNNNKNFSASYVNGSGVDQAGNIMNRSDVGAYTYGDSHHPHAVTAAGSYRFTYDANGNTATRNRLQINSASYNLPTFLQGAVGGSTYSSTFAYGPDHQRYQQAATYSNGSENTSYAGGLLEKVTGTDTRGIIFYRHYVPTPSGQTLIVSRNSDKSTSTTYVLSDHLGSSDAVLNGSGNFLIQESFGAFGLRRHNNWSTGSPSSGDYNEIAVTTRHGFTFQEELDNIGLIHMNGRVYDPNIGRFLSADPMIGSLADTQSVNPYAYLGNRPLSSTDPTGYLDEIVVTGDPEVDIPVDAALVIGDILFGGLFGAAPPPPPPATALASNSAQEGIGQNACATGSPACSAGPQQVIVNGDKEFIANSPWIDPSDVGKPLFGGVIAEVDPTPGVTADGQPYAETVTVTAQRASSLPPGAPVPFHQTNPNWRRAILGTFGLSWLPYMPGYDATNCWILATAGQFCGTGGMLNAAVGTFVPEAKVGATALREGSFSIVDWAKYPAGVPRPTGPFRLLQGSEYSAARSAANSANRALRGANPSSLAGRQIHEIQPVKFGGGPTDLANKIPLTGPQHSAVTNWWNNFQRYLEGLGP